MSLPKRTKRPRRQPKRIAAFAHVVADSGDGLVALFSTESKAVEFIEAMAQDGDDDLYYLGEYQIY